MPQAIMAIAAVVGAALTYKQAREQKKAGRQAQELANKNVKLARDENERRMALQKEQNIKDASARKAAAAASGARGFQGLFDYYDDLAQKDMDYLAKYGQHQVQIEGQKGVVAKKQSDAAKMGLYASAASQVGSAASAFIPGAGSKQATGGGAGGSLPPVG